MLLLTAFCFSGNSQIVDLGVSWGYGIPIGSANVESLVINDLSGSIYDEEQSYFSLGQGSWVKGEFRFIGASNVGVTLGLSYHIGGKSEFQDVRIIVFPKKTVSSIYARGLMIDGGLTFSGSEDLSVRPYSHFKLALYTGKVVKESDATYLENTTYEKWEYLDGFGFGFNGTLGLDIPAGGSSVFFIEMKFAAMNYIPSKADLVEARSNDNDVLDGYNVRDSHIIYKEDYTYNYNEQVDDNLPMIKLREPFPMSHFAFGIGFRFLLSQG